jgi:hypothetical protein
LTGQPLPLNPLKIPNGTWIIGANNLLRSVSEQQHGFLSALLVLTRKIPPEWTKPSLTCEKMANVLNADFTEFIDALNQKQVEYILVGGYAVIFHGYNRTTGDLDIWVNPTSANYKKLQDAFQFFKMPVFDMTEEKFLQTENYDVFSFGRPPVQIEILTKVKGLEFQIAWSRASFSEFDGVMVKILDIRDLKIAKKAAGRAKDQADLENL